MKNMFLSLVVAAVSITSPLFAAEQKAESYERIVAVVDGKVILESDIMNALYQYKNMPDFTALDGIKLKAAVLNKLIDEKIILAKARIDTLLVGEDERRELVDAHIAKLAVNFPTQEQLAQRIKAETGMTLSKFREYVGIQLEQQAVLNKVRGKYVGRVTATPKDVQTFFSAQKESLPKQYNCVKLRKLAIEITPNKSRLDSVRSLADSLITELNRGSSFDSLADQFSQDYSAGRGGDLGFFKKGAHDPEFERSAFNLAVGRYTETPVKTKKGYHIIKLLQRQDNDIQAAHIFLAVEPDKADTLAAKSKIDSLLIKAASESSFTALVSQYSTDKATNKKGGLLGWFERAQLPTEYEAPLEGLKDSNITIPFIEGDAWVALLIEKTEAVRSLTLEDDWSQIEFMTLNSISQAKLDENVKKWRSLVYVNVLDEELKKALQ